MAVVSGELSRRVSREAEQVQVGRLALTAVVAVLYGLGWLAAVVFVACAAAARFSVAAVRVGWVDGRAMAAGRRGGPSR